MTSQRTRRVLHSRHACLARDFLPSASKGDDDAAFLGDTIVMEMDMREAYGKKRFVRCECVNVSVFG